MCWNREHDCEGETSEQFVKKILSPLDSSAFDFSHAKPTNQSLAIIANCHFSITLLQYADLSAFKDISSFMLHAGQSKLKKRQKTTKKKESEWERERELLLLMVSLIV